MDFTVINSRGKRGELLGRIDRQNSRFRTAKTAIIKFGLHASFVELESAKSALNELDLEKDSYFLILPLHTRTKTVLVIYPTRSTVTYDEPSTKFIRAGACRVMAVA
ncbi:uncharacterized protein TNCV_66841 [Trichonephila clavipes]|nr:uncharacterized protein TNCV_66841 [Trichonephila clavipes]